jgi:hypothetical protein
MRDRLDGEVKPNRLRSAVSPAAPSDPTQDGTDAGTGGRAAGYPRSRRRVRANFRGSGQLAGELLGALLVVVLIALPSVVSFAVRALFPGQVEDVYGLAFGLTILAELLAFGLAVLVGGAVVLWRLLRGD